MLLFWHVMDYDQLNAETDYASVDLSTNRQWDI